MVASSSHKPDIKVVGLADKATQESISRIQAALRNSPGAPGLAGLRRGPLGKLGA